MCQLFVAEAIAPLRMDFPTFRYVHYMDDILLAAKDDKTLNKAYTKLVKLLEMHNLVIASDKVQ
ncbi:reverse transcriptase domain-containing protein, partial [Escherichia coli]